MRHGVLITHLTDSSRQEFVNIHDTFKQIIQNYRQIARTLQYETIR